MKYIKYNIALFPLFLFAVYFSSCSLFFGTTPPQIAVTAGQANSAYLFAESRLDKTYSWGANGPDEFDCSGLIVWSYRQVIGQNDIFFDGSITVDDCTMNTFYKYNVVPIEDTNLVTAGDIIFITDTEGIITHGGLVKEISQNETVTFINASSYYGKVALDTWTVYEIVREQWIVGFGRVKIIAQ